MTELRHEDVRDLAPELALDIADGEEREAALRHLAGCAECRRFVSDLTSTADSLLLLSPGGEPPVGFETRVLERLGASPTVVDLEAERRRRWARWRRLVLVPAAAAILAAGVGAVSVFVATSQDRQLAASYRGLIPPGAGSFFDVAPLDAESGRIGTAWGYEGDPSWVFVSVPEGEAAGRTYDVVLTATDGRTFDLGEAEFDADRRGWGKALPVGLTEVQELRFEGADGDMTATFDAESPWE